VSQREDHVSAKENVMRRTTIAIGIVALVEAAGCTPVTMYSTMSTHTLDTAADQQTDVVWLLESNKGLLRCSNSATGPVCVKPQIVAPGAAPPPGRFRNRRPRIPSHPHPPRILSDASSVTSTRAHARRVRPRGITLHVAASRQPAPRPEAFWFSYAEP
jgi:hypothetical protein